MNLRNLSNNDLIVQTENAVRIERASTAAVVKYFQEISDRKLYLERGFPTLFEMVTKEFGYCAGSAMRRINSMRLVKEIPSVEAKIESGELSLTVTSDIQSFFYQEAKESRPYSMNAKIELIESCLKKSKREVERELCRRSPEREKRETIRQVSADRLRISLTISEELNGKLNRLRDLLSHTDPNLSTEALIEKLAELGLDKYDPVRKANRANTRQIRRNRRTNSGDKDTSPDASDDPAKDVSSPNFQDSTTTETIPFPPAEMKPADASNTRTRVIKAVDRHELASRAEEAACEYIDPLTNRLCGSQRFLEMDHIEPYSYGGDNEASNLQYMCSAHNKLRWSQRESSRVRSPHLKYG